MLKKVPSEIKNHRAKRLSRHSGILFAPANGKLYFETLETFSASQNRLRLQRAKHLQSRCFYK